MHSRPSTTFARAASVIAVAAVATIVVACAGGSDPGWTYMPLPPSTPPASASGSPAASGTPAATATAAASASGTPVASGSASANVIELEETNSLQILQNGQQVTMLNVVAGQTYTFRITNSAGFIHDFYLGPADKLGTGDVTGLPGVPEFDSGVKEFTWTADASATGWEFGCTVPGHYQTMHGSLMLGGQ